MSGTSPPAGLESLLRSKVPAGSYEALCSSVLPAIVDGIAAIAKSLRSSHQVALAGSANAFGDDQLNVDVAAENIVRAAAAKCPAVVTASSEEEPVERSTREGEDATAASAGEQYTFAFDPLDGSSIIAPNWSVGTIIGIWEGLSALHQAPATRQVAAVLGVYGPRTTAIIALRVPGAEGVCIEVGVGEQGVQDCQVIRESVRLQASPPFKTRYFAPANLRAAAEDSKYAALVNHYISNKYTLRYSGGLVPDVVHALVKSHGLYVSPVTAASKAKLRRLYELFPLALIVECAGGKAVDPVDGSDILSKSSKDTDERGGLICGTAEEVDFAAQSLLA
ncbi:hypothetical protein PFICI_12355 [Pestalotiopsis fici W106-1]|uniref:Sedoheptulose-1,7-bisphosphatase n=1 Tax=Pestalotiopsis fici (strain W106-1 / CGMCC3.15140) TaxID=1229662 RepID=W3WRG2_PESFW|nr:uncharacterized protein PFICI_12355 [Pestalotiopsis fici W106-1]ETS75411.1 hypothetical protein PFICI_12355 [Pestalotiopsis fici W106-1]